MAAAHAHHGFTLIELLLATALMGLLVAGGYAALAAGTRSAGKIKRHDAMVQHAQAALESMTSDIRASVKRGDYCLTALDAQHEGNDADTMDFIVAAQPRLAQRQDEDDKDTNRYEGYCEVGYSIGNESSGELRWLLRREDSSLDDDPLEGGSFSQVGPYVSGLNLEFYDGFEWVAGWSKPKKFPSAVRIRIVVVDADELETPEVFSTTVAFPQE